MYHIIEESDFDLRSKFYLMRSLISSVNAQLIGIAGSAIRKDARTSMAEDDETPTIDKVNEFFASQDTNTAPVGLEPSMDPRELAGLLIAMRNKWLEMAHEYPDDILKPGIGDTIQFMLDRPIRELSSHMVDAVAKATGLKPEEIKAAQLATFHQDRKFLMEHREQIVEWINETPYGDSESAYDLLPVRYQVRVLKKFEDYLQKQRVRAIQAIVGRNIASAMGELVILNNVVAKTDEYKDTRAKREPDFLEAYVAA